MREHYSPTLTAAEKRHEAKVQEQPCFGCGANGSEAHHVLLAFPGKRWRRDHHFRLPVCGSCHRGEHGIHGFGSERIWLNYIGRSEAELIAYVKGLWDNG